MSIKKIHPKYKTPHIAILFQTIISCAITVLALGTYKILLSLLLPLALFMYSAVLLSVSKLRKSRVKFDRPFRAPFGNVGPFAVIFFFLLLLLLWIIETENSFLFLLAGLALIALGMPAYVLVKLQTDAKFVEKFLDRLNFFIGYYIGIFIYTKKKAEKVARMLDIRKESSFNIIDYGSNIGLNTLALSEKYPNSKIVSVDISEKQIGKTLAKINEMYKASHELPNVIHVKMSRIAPFEPNTFHRLVCVIAINYFINPLKEISALNRILKKRGKAVFLAIKAPFLIHHSFLNYDSSIKQIFAKAGFRNVEVKREKKFLREYIYIQAGN